MPLVKEIEGIHVGFDKGQPVLEVYKKDSNTILEIQLTQDQLWALYESIRLAVEAQLEDQRNS